MKVSQNLRKSFFIILIFLLVVFSILTIRKADASIFDNIKNLFLKNNNSNIKIAKNILTDDDLLKPNPKTLSEIDNADNLIINSDGTLSAHSGTMRISTEKEKVTDGIISLYEVKKGDTIDSVAKLFGISKNTIIWANNLTGKTIKEGDTILIFPVTGVEYTVKNNGSLEDLAKKYNADAREIAEYNGIPLDTKLSKGDTIFIPDAEAVIPTSSNTNKKGGTTKTTTKYANASKGFFIRPVEGCTKTQNLHGSFSSAVDIGCKIGTTVIAAAGGVVIKAENSGYNGGYGQVIIISHSNGTQAIYAHLSSVEVKVGQKISQGEEIGKTGNTGKSTGPHLHFETRGISNPF